MKHLKDLAKDLLNNLGVQEPHEGLEVHCVLSKNGIIHLPFPVDSDKVKCPDCDGSQGFVCRVDPKAHKFEKMWFCASNTCLKAQSNSPENKDLGKAAILRANTQLNVKDHPIQQKPYKKFGEK